MQCAASAASVQRPRLKQGTRSDQGCVPACNLHLPTSGTPDKTSAKCTNLMPPTAASPAAKQLSIRTAAAAGLLEACQAARSAHHLQTEKLSTWLVNIRIPLRTFRGKGNTSRNVSSMGGGSRKFTRTLQPVNEDILLDCFCKNNRQRDYFQVKVIRRCVSVEQSTMKGAAQTTQAVSFRSSLGGTALLVLC